MKVVRNRECFTAEGRPKRRYESRAQAKRAGRQVDQAQGLRPYRCQHCGYFHLGHYPTGFVSRGLLRSRHRLAASHRGDLQ